MYYFEVYETSTSNIENSRSACYNRDAAVFNCLETNTFLYSSTRTRTYQVVYRANQQEWMFNRDAAVLK